MLDYDIDDEVYCALCGHSPLHNKDCDNIACELGGVDESFDDPINFVPGERVSVCGSCFGTEVIWWCPGCGADLKPGQVKEYDFSTNE